MPKAIYRVYVVCANGEVVLREETSLRAVKTLCHGLNLSIGVFFKGEKILWRVKNRLSSSCNKFSSHSILMERRMNKSGYLFLTPYDK